MVQEGCPYISSACFSDVDVWSARNMNPLGANGVAARTEGSIDAMHAAYRSGLVFDGKIDIPIIDWRHYLDGELNMHNARQSFAEPGAHARARRRRVEPGDLVHGRAARARLRPDADGARCDGSVADEHRAHPGRRREQARRRRRPLLRHERHADLRRRDAWNGIIDAKRAGPCTQLFQIHGTSRTVAGGPFDEELYKCKLQPVDGAIARGLYGSWQPTETELARLQQIFPGGVCDYAKGDAGRPPGF